MEFQFTNLLPSNWMHALCATLFHSLWMGVFLAVLTSLIIILTKKSSAVLRYNLLTGVLCLFVAGMIVVFYRSLGFSFESAPTATEHGILTTGPSPYQNFTQTGISHQFNAFLNLWTSYSSQIVLVWFLIICAKSIQMMIGLHTVFYLKRTSVFDAGSFWENKVASLSATLGIRRHVQLLQSGLAKVPMAAGHLKPVILLPLGMLNGLSTAEVEAILSHELAHIKRRDYLVNLLQSLIEIVFFFNPAVLWVSKLIREERENCCDDLALTCTGSKHDYIKALISCEEFQNNTPAYAMAFTGRKNQLLERVSRMVFNKTTSLNKIEKTILTVVLISSLILTAAFRKKEESKPPLAPVTKTRMKEHHEIVVQDTTKRTLVKKTTTKTEAHQTTTTKDKDYIEEERKARLADARRVEHELEAVKDRAQAIKDQSQKAADNSLFNKEIERYNKEMAQYSRQISKNSAKYAAEAKKYATAATKYANDQLRYSRGEVSVPPTPPVPPPTPATPPTPPTPPTSPSPARFAPNGSKSSSTSQQITQSLLKDGLINQAKNFSYKLNKDELEINGVTQPEAVHRKYVNRFLKDNLNRKIETTVSSN
ncbi:M56 family metallopeptidase [Pedobacter sp.]|jgi:bla regulator protein BlaR1|uniref:M56 family metallopeptidase n=1 Tax=Pedobacter sp. TaxID=1411316 RepID=UPI002BB5B7FB|nr:M56 family metallopeptidase [Pedobacter sp.]HWW42095.1 M56 family metallopeptidase [Pedobacter sp.]